MSNITKKMYQTALSVLFKRYANATLEGIHSIGRMIFKKAVELDILKNDLTQYAVVPKHKKTVEELEDDEEAIKYLVKEELAHYLDICKELGNFSIMKFSPTCLYGLKGWRTVRAKVA